MQKDIKSIITEIKTREIFDINSTASLSSANPNKVTMLSLPTYTGDLIGRTLTVSGSTLSNNKSVTITGRTGNVLTTSGTFVTESSVNVLIQRDTAFEIELDAILATLNSLNSSILTSFDIPTKNDYFKLYEKLTETLIQQIDSYKVTSNVNDYIRDINVFLAIEPLNFTRTQLQNYKDQLQAAINIIDTEQASIIAYFERVKALLLKLKITDLKIADDSYIDLYNSRSSVDKTSIDTYYSYYQSTSLDEYTDYKQQLLYEIKID